MGTERVRELIVHITEKYVLPPTFHIRFEKPDRHTYLLRTSQVIAIPVEKAFSFFEKPENLSEITPDWLNFRFDNKGGQSETFEGAEFDYTIRFISSLDHKPKTFISASAVGYYGDQGEHEIDETAIYGNGFLADVCVAWENEARRAETLGMRSVQVRTAPVLDGKGGFIGKLMKSMNFGFAVQFGSGQNWFTWIHMEDLISIYETAVSNESLSGPVNACSPEPVRFRELLDHLREYRKAVVIPFPVSLFRLVAKELADELTNSQRIVPAKLQDMQFRFVYGNLKEALKDVFT